MLSVEDLKDVAKIKGIRNLGYAEKDYLLELALLFISRNTKRELVFKGGTALYKFYRLDRFSEDIDFSMVEELDVESMLDKVTTGLNSFGIEAEMKTKYQSHNTVMASIRAKGPLYTGSNQTLSKIEIDINLKSKTDLPPKVANYSPLYPDIPSYTIQVMKEEEILAEKIRAIMTRDKPRDIYDLWFLMNKGVSIDIKLAGKKMEYYGEKWDQKTFEKKLEIKEQTWKIELKALIDNVPELTEVRETIMGRITAQQ
ncbi:MAG: nucleotidyl transferase AbiEii/AbiGii toxin family protein [Candidatus Altiarchaeia archaeon]